MPKGPSQEEVNVSSLLSGFRADFRFVLGGAAFLVVVAAIVTTVVPPIFEAKFYIVFPSRSSDMQARIPSFVQAENPSGMLYLGGLLDSRTAREQIGGPLDLTIEDVKESLRVEPQLASRQLWVSFRADSSKTALEASELAMEFLKSQESQTAKGVSEKRLEGIRERLALKSASVEKLREQIAEYLRTSTTIPTNSDGFTGGSYMRGLKDAQAKLDEVDDRIEARSTAAKRIGIAGEQGLPTGLESERLWRDKLLVAEVAFDEAKAKYQPGTQQYRDAEQSLEAVQKSLKSEIAKFVMSVTKGADQEMAYLVAERTVLALRIEDLERKALRAPGEATEFRKLLDLVEGERAAYVVIKTEEEEELLTLSTLSQDWLVLDEPYLEDEPINKSYLLNCGVAALVGALLGIVFSPRRTVR